MASRTSFRARKNIAVFWAKKMRFEHSTFWARQCDTGFVDILGLDYRRQVNIASFCDREGGAPIDFTLPPVHPLPTLVLPTRSPHHHTESVRSVHRLALSLFCFCIDKVAAAPSQPSYNVPLSHLSRLSLVVFISIFIFTSFPLPYSLRS